VRERPRYIAVEGPIGAGKSTLARILADEMGAQLVPELPEQNPFLGSFYEDPKRYALATQLFFLLQRYTQQQDLLQGDLFARGGLVSDYLFSKDRLFASLTLSSDEMALYDRIFDSLHPRVLKPDLVVYLQARLDVLMARIHKRGRKEEQTIKPEYVQEVAGAYTRYFFDYDECPLLIVNASDIDFVADEEDRNALLEVVEKTHVGVNHWSRTP